MIKKDYKQPSMRILKLQLEKMIAASPGNAESEYDNGPTTPVDAVDGDESD